MAWGFLASRSLSDDGSYQSEGTYKSILKRGKNKNQSYRVSWSNTNTFETYDTRGDVSEDSHEVERDGSLTGDTFDTYDTRGEVSESYYNPNEEERDGGLIDDFNLIYNGDTQVTFEDSTVGGLTHRGVGVSTSQEESMREQYESLTYDDGTWDGSMLESRTYTFDGEKVVVSMDSELGSQSAVSSSTTDSPEESIEQNRVEQTKPPPNPMAKPQPSKEMKTTPAKPASDVPPAPLKLPGTHPYLAACASSMSEKTDAMDRYGLGEEDNRTLSKSHPNEPKYEEAHQPVMSPKLLGTIPASVDPSRNKATVPIKKKREKKKKGHSSANNLQSAPFTLIQPNIKKAKEETPKVKKSKRGFAGILRSFASKGAKNSKNSTVDDAVNDDVASPPPRLSAAKEEGSNHPVKRRVWKSASQPSMSPQKDSVPKSLAVDSSLAAERKTSSLRVSDSSEALLRGMPKSLARRERGAGSQQSSEVFESQDQAMQSPSVAISPSTDVLENMSLNELRDWMDRRVASDDESVTSLTKKEHGYEGRLNTQKQADEKAGHIGLILPFLDNVKWPSSFHDGESMIKSFVPSLQEESGSVTGEKTPAPFQRAGSQQSETIVSEVIGSQDQVMQSRSVAISPSTDVLENMSLNELRDWMDRRVASDDESVTSLTKKEHGYEGRLNTQKQADEKAGHIGLILPFLDNVKWPSSFHDDRLIAKKRNGEPTRDDSSTRNISNQHKQQPGNSADAMTPVPIKTNFVKEEVSEANGRNLLAIESSESGVEVINDSGSSEMLKYSSEGSEDVDQCDGGKGGSNWAAGVKGFFRVLGKKLPDTVDESGVALHSASSTSKYVQEVPTGRDTHDRTTSFSEVLHDDLVSLGSCTTTSGILDDLRSVEETARIIYKSLVMKDGDPPDLISVFSKKQPKDEANGRYVANDTTSVEPNQKNVGLLDKIKRFSLPGSISLKKRKQLHSV